MATLHRTRATLSCALALAVMAIAPAAASADPEWHQLTDPPGGSAFAIVSGVPHVAYASSAGIRVARPTPSGDAWQQVGGPIHHTTGAAVYDPSLAQAPDKHLWVGWTELDSAGIRQARVARLDGNVWHEVVGGARPINKEFDSHYGPRVSWGYEPVLAFFGSTVYVAYTQDTPSEYTLSIVRLKADGSAFERVDPPVTQRVEHPRIAASGGNLYAAASETLGPGAFVARLNAARTGWEPLPEPSGQEQGYFGDLADLGGSPGVLFAHYSSFDLDAVSLGAGDAWGPVGLGPVATSDVQAFDPESLVAAGGVPYAAWLEGGAAPHSVEVAFLDGGNWVVLPSPSAAGSDALLARLATGSTGVYVMWTEAGATHVAKLGQTVVPPPDGNGGGDNSGGDGGDGDPSAPPEPVPTPTPGACGIAIVGTPLADVLNGTAGRDSISGGAGNDKLFGVGGADCLFGGSGNDLLSGGTGNDRVFGGSGNDIVHGDGGRDELYGDAGNDRITGGPGSDDIGGGRGNDRIDVRGGGSDSVDCGPGHDTVLADASDGTWRCERVIGRR